MIKNLYKCNCGKEFNNPQAYNGHKANCAIHHKLKGDYDEWETHKGIIYAKQIESRKQHSKIIKDLKQQTWIQEGHKCKICGKIMTEKFGSGIFCSRSCANTRIMSKTTKENISNGVKSSSKCRENNYKRKRKKLNEYLLNPKLCKYCGQPLQFEHKNQAYCSEQCRKYGQSASAYNKLHSVDTSKHWRGNFKWGRYKGFWCDSSWELAFVMYCLDNNINIVQNHDSFEYIYSNNIHRYTPDFIVNNVYIEIKGYYTSKDKEKLLQFPKHLNIVLITNKDVQKYIKYAKLTYGNNFFNLYDKDCPNWLTYST